MKKVLIIAVTIVAVVALGNVLMVSAQGGTQPNQPNATCPLGYTCPLSGTMPYGMMGRGMMGGRGGMMHGGAYTGTMPMQGNMRGMHAAMLGANGMHEQVWTALAQKLGMTYAELDTAVQNGQTVAQLAQTKGISLDDLKTAALTALKTSFGELVKQGVITQEQADWMLDHMDEMPMFNFDQGYGPGMMHGRVPGGMMNGRVPGGTRRGYQQPTGPRG